MCVSKNVSVSCAYTQGKREQFSGFNRTLDAINNVFRKFSAFHDETGRLNVDGMNIISNDGSNKLNRSRKARVRSEERVSRNAETDLVCRLPLEKKKNMYKMQAQLTAARYKLDVVYVNFKKTSHCNLKERIVAQRG